MEEDLNRCRERFPSLGCVCARDHGGRREGGEISSPFVSVDTRASRMKVVVVVLVVVGGVLILDLDFIQASG